MKKSENFTGIAALVLGGVATLFPTAASAEDFDGPYAVLQGGVSILDIEGTTIAGPFDDSETEAFVGGALGYRAPLGESNIVLGAEADLGFNTDSSDMRYGVSGIAGYRLGETSLLYARAGYGWRDDLGADLGDGLVLGGGFETRLTDSVNLRIDYKHLDLGETEFPDATTEISGHEITGGIVLNF